MATEKNALVRYSMDSYMCRHTSKLNFSFSRSRRYYRLLLGLEGYILDFSTHFLVTSNRLKHSAENGNLRRMT